MYPIKKTSLVGELLIGSFCFHSFLSWAKETYLQIENKSVGGVQSYVMFSDFLPNFFVIFMNFS